MYQALYRKWRPSSFDDVVGQSHITDTLKAQVASGKISHAYLFTGTRGTGKTTCAKILAKAANCQHPINGNPCNKCSSCIGIDNGSIVDVLEIDAASNNGVDNVRALRDEAVYSPASVNKRVYIIDEVHMLSNSAFNALLKILEEPPAHLLFILATTEVHKVPATISSRCQRFAFKRITPNDIAARLAYVAEKEGISLTEGAASMISRIADGALRNALSLLDQCAAYTGSVDEECVRLCLGIAAQTDLADLLDKASVQDASAALEIFHRIYNDGTEVASFLDELCILCRDLLMIKAAPSSPTSLLAGRLSYEYAAVLADRLGYSRLINMISIIQTARNDIKRSTDPKIDGELCVVRLCMEESADIYALEKRISKLEQLVSSGGAIVPPKKNVPQTSTVLTEKPREAVHTASADIGVRETSQSVEETVLREERKSAKPAFAANSADWSAILENIRNELAPGDFALLSNPASITFRRKDDIITLYADTPFVAMMINKQSLLSLLKTASGAKSISVISGPAPEEESTVSSSEVPESDNFDDLVSLDKKFDNIIIN